MDNYYCNGLWFKTYDEACTYAGDILLGMNKYYVIFTKAEKESIINAIDHEEECGK